MMPGGGGRTCGNRESAGEEETSERRGEHRALPSCPRSVSLGGKPSVPMSEVIQM